MNYFGLFVLFYIICTIVLVLITLFIFRFIFKRKCNIISRIAEKTVEDYFNAFDIPDSPDSPDSIDNSLDFDEQITFLDDPISKSVVNEEKL